MNTKQAQLTDRILTLCPSLTARAIYDRDAFEVAIIAMARAHTANGGYNIGLYETAVQYLKSLYRKEIK